jgi:(1->4)-alpha-D-glucan 1-alpha-D-glucosylmutase
MLKAIRESKRHTSWLTLNQPYEEAVGAFVHALLGRLEDNLFLQDFHPFARTIAWYGALNSLSITLVKLCSPGVPDIYQGNEMLDFSLVDPDNRRPVDYAQRRAALALTQTQAPEEWLRDIHDGHAKLALIARVLAFRKQYPALFEQGDYLPLKTEGEHANSLLAFARRQNGQSIVIAVGRLYASLDVPAEILPLGAEAWGDTALELGKLPDGLALHNVLTGETLMPQQGMLQAAQLFARFPLALLHYQR